MSPLDEKDFQSQLMSFVHPKSFDESKLINSLVSLGFPSKNLSSHPNMCTCHLELIYEYYRCPKCYSKVCNIPMRCPVCELWLAMPNQIMRQTRLNLDLFVCKDENVESAKCYACEMDSNYPVQCQDCSNTFCIDCDVLIHQNLKMCPGCA